MDELNRQVRRAQRRLVMQRFVGVLGWCWGAALLAALAGILVGKFWPVGVDDWIWAAGALGVGLTAAMIWTVATRERAISAAIELDRRFALKERVSSSLALSPAEQDTAAGQALLADALRRVERIDVGEKFGVALPRQTLFPLLPAAAVLLVALFVPPAAIETQAEAKPDDPNVQKQIKKTTEDLRKRLAEQRKNAQKENLPQAEELLRKLEQAVNEHDKKADRKETLAQLKDLTRELQARRDQVSAAEEVQRQLKQLKPTERGPGDKLADAMKKGDFDKAANEIEKIKEQIANSKLGEADKAQLAKQLDEMKKNLEQMAEARNAAQKDLKDRADQMQAAGQKGEAGKLQEQFEKMAKQGQQMQGLDNLAQQLGQCAQAMRDGKMGDAENAMQQMKQGLGQMQQQLDEQRLLDNAIDQMGQARDNLKPCDQCGGKGCKKCDGQGFMPGDRPGEGMGQGEGEGKPGQGLGRGQGEGARPESKTDTKFYDTKVPGKVGEGAADFSGMTDGPGLKLRTEKQIQESVEATRDGSTDPLTGRKLPKKQREHAQEYFDRIRDGK